MGVHTLTAEQRRLKAKVAEQLLAARRALLIRHPFTGALAMRLALIPVCDDRVTSFCTDGTHLYVDVEYFQNLWEEERITLIAHAVWHCALLHFLRREDREEERFNYAVDIEVGLLLQREQFSVDMSEDDEKTWKGMSAEQIYEQLPAFPNGCRFGDIHLYPQKTIPGVFKLTANNDSSIVNCNREDVDCSCLQPISQTEQTEINPMYDPDFAPSFQEAELSMAWRSAVQQEAARCKKRGTLPAEIEELIDPSDHKSRDWKQVLLDFVTLHLGGERQWLPPNRRHVYKKLYLPSRARKMEIELVIAIDTSGSTVPDFPDFMAELQGLVENFGDYTITVIQCDLEIHLVEEYSSNSGKELPKKGKFRGTGGTDLRPPFEYIREHMPKPPAVMIYLTDGYGPAPRKEPEYPVIWCLTAGGTRPAEWGISINMEDRSYECK